MPSRTLDRSPDVFISHASEDKAAVARPLAEALRDQGWNVWLDELELTVGDSLSLRIDQALARCRFGIVVLSPSFFAKPWTQRELGGLVAREVASGSKVILPVWHEIDHLGIAAHSPTLADRLVALTSAGMTDVATQISVALKRTDGARESSSALVRGVVATREEQVPGIPDTPTLQRALAAERPPFWEYLLFGSYIMLGRDALEPKWHDHELHMPRGERREFSDAASVLGMVRRETEWIRRQIEARTRVFAPSVLEQAFGPDGEPGNVDRIAHVTGHMLRTYEALMDWAASIRNTSVPGECTEVVDALAKLVDKPVQLYHDWLTTVVTEISRIPALYATRRDGDPPFVIRLTLVLEIADDDLEAISAAFERLREQLEGEGLL